MQIKTGQELKSTRQQLKISGTTFAERCGVHRNTLSNWETGDELSPIIAAAVSRILDEFVEGVNNGDKFDAMEAALRKCFAILSGNELNKSSLIEALTESTIIIRAIDKERSDNGEE